MVLSGVEIPCIFYIECNNPVFPKRVFLGYARLFSAFEHIQIKFLQLFIAVPGINDNQTSTSRVSGL